VNSNIRRQQLFPMMIWKQRQADTEKIHSQAGGMIVKIVVKRMTNHCTLAIVRAKNAELCAAIQYRGLMEVNMKDANIAACGVCIAVVSRKSKYIY